MVFKFRHQSPPGRGGLHRLAGIVRRPRRERKSRISLTADLDPDRRWRAIRALGWTVTARMYDREPEQARQVVRQLIWNLNEESGGIGWGMPEAFGEILAQQVDLAREYACLLACYLVEDESFPWKRRDCKPE